MPEIRWTDLPPNLRQHLFDRVAERQIPAEDLYKLKLWRESEPEAPAGPWYKDFGSFKICGEGQYPKTFLLPGQAAKGQKLTSPGPTSTEQSLHNSSPNTKYNRFSPELAARRTRESNHLRRC